MRINQKLFLLAVLALAGMVFYQGCQKGAETAAPSTKSAQPQTKAKAKAPETAVKEVNAVTPAEKKVEAAAKAKEPEVAVKEVNAVMPAEKKVETIKEANVPPVAPIAAKPAESGDIAVTVNDGVITEAEVEAKMKPQLDRIAGRMDPNMVGQYKKRLHGQVVEGMILERLLDEQVKKAGITATDNDVNDKMNELLTQQGMTMDGLKSLLQQQGQNLDDLKQQMKKGLAYEKLVDSQVGPVEINDTDALNYYKENEEDYNKPEEVRASHILIKVAPTATDEEKAAAKAKIEKLLKDVKGGGDFAVLARDNSDCPSKVKGGDLGFFERGSMVKPFEDVAFALQPGQISDVVETQFGYHIIKVTERKPAGLTPFEKAKPDIIKTLQQVKKGEVFRKYIAKLKTDAKVVYPPGKEPVMMRPMGPPREVEMTPKPE